MQNSQNANMKALASGPDPFAGKGVDLSIYFGQGGDGLID